MYPTIADLGFIGDRRTSAAVGRDGTVYWFAPRRFDRPSIFNGLLDPAKGSWRIIFPGASPAARRYIGSSAVLETRLAGSSGTLVIEDWMTMGEDAHPGVFCRMLSPAPVAITIALDAWEEYGGRRALPVLSGGAAVFEDGLHVFASHPMRLEGGSLQCVVPKGNVGWTIIADGPTAMPDGEAIRGWKAATLARWDELDETTTYAGPFAPEVAASLRQLRLLVFEPTGGVAAAVTAGLPEVIGGKRNYDYRYCWLRDTALVVRALLRTTRRTREGDSFLRLFAQSRETRTRNPLDAVVTVDGRPAPGEFNPPLAGYRGSGPVRIGNRAAKQFQLGALGTFLLAAGLLYCERRARPHWDVVAATADFVVGHWHLADSGIWESEEPRQYTTSKVFAACGLEAIAGFADAARQRHYRSAAQAIRRYVMRHCLTPKGAFAAFVGSTNVDVSSALFPVWGFCEPDSAEMEATLSALYRRYETRGVFRRADETPQSNEEGAFLPGGFWVAQYWAMRGDEARARHHIEAGLRHANDLGILPEEAHWRTGQALGNVPLGMAHASFLSAVAELAGG